jgi:hypothetical protein
LSISRKESQIWQKVAAVPQGLFDAALTDKTVMPTTAGMLRLIAEPKSNPRKGEKRVLPLSAICADEQAQPRAALEEDRVAEYVEAMMRVDKFPPPVVFQDKQKRYWLADGFHRYHAAVRLKRKAIECIVHPGELRDAILYSSSANATHGLPRSNADKRRAVTKLLNDEEWGKWSDRDIGRRCNVTHDLVGKVRAELTLPDTGDVASMERTFTHPKTGKPTKMKTGNIGGGEPKPAANDARDDVAQPDKPAPEPPQRDLAVVVGELPAPVSADPASLLDTIRGTIRGLTNIDFDQVATIPANHLLEVRSELDEAAGELRAVITRAIENATVREKEPPPASRGVREGDYGLA